MRYAVSASVAVLAAALASPAFAQLEDKPVRMEKAPFHIPVFQNDYLILLNVNIPPGRNTGYHIHYADSVSVNLMPASQTNQNYGSNEVSPPGAAGEGELAGGCGRRGCGRHRAGTKPPPFGRPALAAAHCRHP